MHEFIKILCTCAVLICLCARTSFGDVPTSNETTGTELIPRKNDTIDVPLSPVSSDEAGDIVDETKPDRELLLSSSDESSNGGSSSSSSSHSAPSTTCDNSTSPGSHGQSSGGHHEEPRTRFAILEFNFEHVKPMYMVTCWLLAACVLKILFHMAPWLSGHVPESAALITLGILLGLILRFSGVGGEHYKLDAYTFFYFMLPPIVFDSGFHMPNRAFFGNIGAILLYAVIGTVFNAMAIGLTIYGVCQAVNYKEVGVLDCLLYGSLISAVDPVGVLSVFEEVHVNEMLYIIVFGESLLNDAVTVVLYNVFNGFVEINKNGSINTQDIIFGVISFFVVGIGGTLVGVIFGLITAFVTRFTDHVRVIEPVFIFIFAYLSYLTADMVRMSGIMAAVFCGITMRRYVNTNVHRKSATTINYAVKMLAVVSETVVFMFIGMTSVLDLVEWNPAFFFTSLAACAVFRPIGVILQTAFINRFRTIKLTWLDQFIMSYGGLRGPIAYALCALINKELIPAREVLLSACMGVIFFTVYVQGGTIRFLVEGLHVKRATKIRPTMNQRIHERLLDHAMAGIEDVAGVHGSHYMRVTWEAFDAKFLKPLLLREVPQTREHGIIKTFSKLNVQEAIKNARERGSSAQLADQGRGRYSSAAFKQPQRISTHESVAEALNMVFARRMSAEFTPGQTITPTETALDLQILDAPVRKKDVDDARIRHILDDAMYKPRHRSKTRQIVSKNTVVEREPSFTNPRTRWQVRELMSTLSPSEQGGGRARKYNQSAQSAERTDSGSQRTAAARSRNLLNVPQISFTRPTPNRADERNGSHRRLVVNEVDEGGLEMHATTSTDEDYPTTAGTSAEATTAMDVADHGRVNVDVDVNVASSPPRQPTAAERQLPWRRTGDDGNAVTLAHREESADDEPQFSIGMDPYHVVADEPLSPGLSSVVSDDDYPSSSPSAEHHIVARPANVSVHPDPPVSKRGASHPLDRVPESPSSDAEEYREEQV